MTEQISSADGNAFGLKVTEKGEALIRDFSNNLVQRMDYQDGYQPIYMGLAAPGTSTGSPNWQIRKNITSGNPELMTAVLFASGNINFDKTWDNRSGTNEEYS